MEFYNIENQTNKWKCWAALSVLGGCKVYHWYDPCDCCFNPCSVKNPKIEPYDNQSDIERKKDEIACCIYIRCFFFIMLCYLIYAMYLCIFIWYDIYYAFCHKIGNGERTFDYNEDIWKNEGSKTFTEQYWINNHQYLFKCAKCSWNSHTFHDFIVNEQRTVPIVNTQADFTNGGINN